VLDILAITGPIYLCIAAGYASVRWNLFSKADMRVFGRFVIQIALPALLFNALASRPLAEVFHGGYLLAYAVGSLFMLLGSLFYAWRVQRKGLTESAYVAMGMSCTNSGFVGYPVMLLTFGPLAGVILALNMIIENLLKLPLLFSVADAGQASGQGRPPMGEILKKALLPLLRNPMILAIMAGFTLALLGLQLPSVFQRTVTLFSTASGGLALFIIGGSLVGLEVRGLRRQVAQIALGKLLLHPLAVLAATLLLPLLGLPFVEGDLRTAAVLSAAMPMLGIYSLLAQRHGFEGFTAAAQLATTALSFFSISAILWLMGQSGWLA
jgi:malonate transporter and related proteins